MEKKYLLGIAQEAINGVHPELTALIIKSLEDKLESFDDTEVRTQTIIADEVGEDNNSSIDKETKSLMEKYQLTQEEVEEVQLKFKDFDGFLESWEVENWKSNQKKLLIDLFDESYMELYIDEENDNEIISYSILEDRITDNPSCYLDMEEVISEHFSTADKEELMSVLGCEEEDDEDEQRDQVQ